jgi:hypothetical protein
MGGICGGEKDHGEITTSNANKEKSKQKLDRKKSKIDNEADSALGKNRYQGKKRPIHEFADDKVKEELV